MSSVSYFIDRADPRAMAELHRWIKTSGHEPASITALEPGGRSDIPVAKFFAGDLRTPEGEAVFLAAHRLATSAAFAGVDWLLDKEPVLADLNRSVGRGTLRLALAQEAWGRASVFFMKILSAQALNPTSRVMVASTEVLPDSIVAEFVPDMIVRSYPVAGLLHQWLLPWRAVVGTFLRRSRLWLRSAEVRAQPSGPTVMVSSMGELSADPTLKGQPHWIWDENKEKALNVLVFPGFRDNQVFDSVHMASLEREGVRLLSRAELGYSRRKALGTALDKHLGSLCRTAFRLVTTGSGIPTRWAAGVTFRLIDEARTVGAVVRERNVGCLLKNECHLLHSYAMAVVAETMQIPLVAYQYSNLALPSVAMLSTADHFLLFHKDFRSVWESEGVAPGNFEAIGYPYDGVFDRVRERAKGHRQGLEAAGVKFVICLFDESVQHDRYGFIHRDTHLRDIHSLLTYLLDMPDVGLVVKSQFRSNTPSQLYPEDPVLHEAAQTGRYLELNVGAERRNLVYPAEAALVADIAVGNIVGATASLEAALAGCRSLLVDSHGQVRYRRDLYDKADIVYPSMRSAVDAIRRLHRGDSSAARLGDWTPIIDQFDSFRDGASTLRLKSFLERLLKSGED